MTDNRIRMTFYNPLSVKDWEEVMTTAYDFKPKQYVWLARACWWILQKIKALQPHFDKNMVVKSVVIDPDEAVTKIIRMAIPQMELMSGIRPERVLIGRNQFAELHKQPDNIWRPFSFEVPVSRTTPPASKYQIPNVEIFSLKVEVIPWMDGVLVL